MARERRKGALLIDWENISGKLSQKGWRCNDPELSVIVAAAEKLCVSNGAELQAKRVFMNAAEATGRNGSMFRNSGFEIVTNGWTKNAADTRLVFAAAELLFAAGYEFFMVASGDADYVEIGKAIGSRPSRTDPTRTCECWIIPLMNEGIREELRRYGHRKFLTDWVTAFPSAPATELGERRLFALQLQDFTSQTGAPPFASARKSAERRGYGYDPVRFGELVDGLKIYPSKNQPWLGTATAKVWVKGKGYQTRTVLKLRVGAPELRRLLLCADTIVAHARSRDSGRTYRGVLAALDHPALATDTNDAEELIEMVVGSGGVTVALDEVKLAQRTPGYLLPLAQIVLYGWHGSKATAGPFTVGQLAGRWAKFGVKTFHHESRCGRNEALAIGNRLTHSAIQLGLINKVGGEAADSTYEPNWSDPLSSLVCDTVKGILTTIHQLAEGRSLGASAADVVTHLATHHQLVPLAPGPVLAEYWLRILGIDQHIELTRDHRNERFQRLRSDSSLVKQILEPEVPA